MLKPQFITRSGAAIYAELGFDLFSEQVNQLDSEAFGLGVVKTCGNPRSVVPNADKKTAVIFPDMHLDLSFAFREGVFE